VPTATALAISALVKIMKTDYGEAQKLFARALKIRNDKLGIGHLRICSLSLSLSYSM
jgi:hypothetical protein